MIIHLGNMLEQPTLLHSLSSISQSDKTREGGFILIVTLALLGLAVATVMLVTTLVRSQTGLVEAQSHQAIARQNALNALNIAIGQLQFRAGTDRVITAPAATLLDSDPLTSTPDGVAHPYWSQVIDTTNSNATWLVSSINGNPDPTASIDNSTAVTLVGEQSTGSSEAQQWTVVEKVPVQTLPYKSAFSPQITGHYAYWTGELNTRANITHTDIISDNLTNDYQLASNQLSLPRRSAIESLFPSISDPDDPETQQKISKVNTPQQLYFIQQNRDELRSHFHDFTPVSQSVLSNPITGGLKRNLTDPTYTDNLITSKIREQITPSYYTTSSPQSYQVQGDDSAHVFAINETPELDEPLVLHQPIITEFCLSMGVFHTQSDRRHRLRFHMHVEWLNPYPYDMGFSHKKASIILANNLPTLEITNETTGDGFTVNLNDFDESMRSNTENESNINSWMEFDKLTSSAPGFLQYGIDAGRIYRMSEPDKIDQPQGLARTIAEDPYRWYWGGQNPPAVGPRPSNRIYGSDTIRIRSITPVRMNLTVIPLMDGASMPKSTHPDDFLAQKGYVTKIENISFDDIDISIRGSSYSRSTSGSFNPNDYRLAFRFKIDETNPTTLGSLGNNKDFRSPVIDFDDPDISALYEVMDVAAAARTADPLTTQERFWDDTERENASSLASDEYQFHLYDVPIIEPLSPGVFSQLHFNERVHPWVGSPNAAVSDFNEVYDRYYFSGSQISANWDTETQFWTLNTPEARVLANHPIHPILQSDGQFADATTMTSAQGAANSMVEGGFNIFSASIAAWKTVLKNQIYLNSSTFPRLPLLRDPFGQKSNRNKLENVFSRLPFAAPNINKQYTDSELSGDPELEPNKQLYRQGIRALDYPAGNAQLEALAESIVTEIRSDIAGSTPGSLPITSLRDLINAGTIDRAIGKTTINDTIDPLSPGYLRQSDIFSLLGTQMTTRSDTFVIRCYGESTRARNGEARAKAYCEAVVQRYPDYMIPSDDAASLPSNTMNIILGRRFRVVSFRWMQAHDI